MKSVVVLEVNMVKQYRVRRATEKDANFLAQAMQDSERAHTGKGIW